ncbi:phenylacetate--CoA ligase family protein [Calidifontibacillus erzurumensis]|uniref:AMP-binding protein n=1 Tax=Calidifontibacillus erzurumensis TaxID=2741433 RepID=A0A8J8GJS3_9BACI|nr:AMP-binding protein [Calidifontibacillus erzurumensis]NSL53053.1 AMP-binding protein [Calidifontibacillus erzurumensis]
MSEKIFELIQYAYEHSEAFKERMIRSNLEPNDIKTKEDLSKLPILKKENLPILQQDDLPFGGLATIPIQQMARVFMSPGPIYDPQTSEDDFWRFAEALKTAGFHENDVVQNTFSYHLSPAGFIFDSALRKLGATVIPAGVGNRELQVQIMKDLGVTGYVGTPSFLAILLDAAEEKGWKVGSEIKLSKAFFTAEKFTTELRQRFTDYGIDVYEGYGTADCGLIAYEDKQGEGLKVTETAIVQICDPHTGEVLSDEGEGEVVVTLFDQHYPLIRFGTGDLSSWIKGKVGERLTGVLGRVSDGVKVKGMFVRENQLTAVLEQLGLPNYQAVVTRKEHQDHLEIFIESDRPIPDNIGLKLKDVIRVTPHITTVLPGELKGESKKLVDKREWK